MKRIGVVANCDKAQAPAVLERLARKADELGLLLIADPATSQLLPTAEVHGEEGWPADIDLLLAFGGDGSMLRAVRTLGGTDIPVMGVNLGSLGFMTSVPQEGLEHALDVLHQGDYKVSQRSVAECEVFDADNRLGHYRALNDVVIGWGASSRVVTLSLSIAGEQVTSYICDGLIVSTPTGSTGHSLSAGGPVLQPETRAFVISVVCPHALSHRPLVVPDNVELEVSISNSPKELLLSVDGQEQKSVIEGNRLVIRRCPTPVRFIHPPSYSYFSVLRQKLGWRGSSL